MRSHILVTIAVVTLVIAVGCSGGGGSSSFNGRTSTTPLATGSVVQVSLGDDAGDRVASLSVTVNAVQLTSDAGATVSLISNPTTLEVSSLAGTTSPLGTVTVPAGTYNKLTITLGGATITVVDPATGTTVQKTFNAPANPFSITLNPVFVSDGSARVINIDFDLHRSVSIDAATGAITFNPLFLVSHTRMQGPLSGGHPDPFTGGVERTVGTVTAVSGSTFTISTAIGLRSLTFTTNSSTVFKGVGGVSSLLTGMLVVVGGQSQSDGTLLAVGVAVVDALRVGPGALGIVAKTSGSPVTQFTLLTQGLAAMTPLMGVSTVPQAGLTINVSSTTNFEPDSDDVDVNGFTFDASSLSPAQTVAIGARSPLSMFSGGTASGLPIIGTLDASQVRLIQQPLSGTVSNVSSTGFTLTVPSESVFAVLANTTTVAVTTRSSTVLKDGFTLTNGQKVVVRGLLFNNNGYKMVATRIGQ